MPTKPPSKPHPADIPTTLTPQEDIDRVMRQALKKPPLLPVRPKK